MPPWPRRHLGQPPWTTEGSFPPRDAHLCQSAFVPTETCHHGLVQRMRFGVEQRGALEICRGCGLPTFESVVADSGPGVGPSTTPEVRDRQQRLEQQMARSNEILVGIRVGVFLILGFLILVFLSAILGLWHLTITR